MDIEISNAIQIRVLQELASYGVHIPITILSNGKDFGTKFKEIFSPWKSKTRYNRCAIEKANITESKIFGVELKEVPMIFSDEFGLVPKFLQDAFKILENHLHVRGLFRQNGSRDRIRKLREQMDKNEYVTDCNPLDIACLIKQFFRELPDPLITPKVFNIFLECQKQSSDQSQLIKSLTKSCHLLPTNNLNTLKYLLKFLSLVANRASENLMNSSNLAVIFAPTLLWSNKESSTEKRVQNITKTTKLVESDLLEILIDNWRRIGVFNTKVIKIADDKQIDDTLYGFGSNISPITTRKRRYGEGAEVTSVTFNVPEASLCEWTSKSIKRLKLSDINETTMSTKKRLLKFFNRKKKNITFSATMAEESIQQSTLGGTVHQDLGRKQIWKKILDKIKRHKRNKVPLNMFNLTSIGSSFMKENMDPNFTFLKEFKNSNNPNITELVRKKDSNAENIFRTPDFKLNSVSQNSSIYAEKLRKSEKQFLERREKVKITFTETILEDDLNVTELDDEDNEGDIDLNQARVDSYNDTVEVMNLSDALANGTYCGQSSKTNKILKSSVLNESLKAPTFLLKDKMSMNSLDSGLGMIMSFPNEFSSSTEELPNVNKVPAIGQPTILTNKSSEDSKRYLKSPLAIKFKSRRALVFDPLQPFELHL